MGGGRRNASVQCGLSQVRREREDEYRQRVEVELERVTGGARLVDQMRLLMRDVDLKLSRAHGDFAAPPYQPEDSCDDDNFFLG